MNTINVLILAGGDGSEHDVSIVSSQYLEKVLNSNKKFNIKKVIIHNNQWLYNNETPCFINNNKTLIIGNESFKIDYVIPCIHGYPGETGDIQSFLEINHIPYFGCDSWGSKACFNKITTKLYMDKANIPNSSYMFLCDNDESSINQAKEFFLTHKEVFVKAASEGSSVGCYKVSDINNLADTINKAFSYCDYVLIEKSMKPRELEVAVYEYQGKLIATNPGEIITPNNNFYTYEEKYNKDSHSSTLIEAQISDEIKSKIKEFALKAFKLLKLRDLSRVDFFLTKDNEIILNEINTFPGMTPISMFPKMLEHHGENMSDFLEDRILNSIK